MRTCLNATSWLFLVLFVCDDILAKLPGARGGSRYVEGWRGFQDADFPTCTIIIQDLKDSKK